MSTTDVFVVTDGLNSTFYTTNNNLTYSSGNSNFNLTAGYSQPLKFTNPTYNDFWKFDEEFDLLWKSFFENGSVFKPVKEKVVNHPCDIQETDNGLRIELTAVGLDKNEIDIIVDSETLRVAYRKSEDEKQKEQKQPQQRMSWQSRQEAGSRAERFRPRRILKLNGSNQSKHKIKESFADKDQRKTKELVHT